MTLVNGKLNGNPAGVKSSNRAGPVRASARTCLVDTRIKQNFCIAIPQWRQREFKVGGRRAEAGGVWAGGLSPVPLPLKIFVL